MESADHSTFTSFTDETRKQYVGLLHHELSDMKKCRYIEKSIYNYTINYAKQKNIKRSWMNREFSLIYMNKFRSVFANLKSDSYLCFITII